MFGKMLAKSIFICYNLFVIGQISTQSKFLNKLPERLQTLVMCFKL